MHVRTILLVVLLAVGLQVVAEAQSQTSTNLTLTEAIAYGLENSPVMKNSTLDVEIARKKVWETTAIGLPQVNGTLSYSYQITQPDYGKIFGAMAPPTTEQPQEPAQGGGLSFPKSSTAVDVTASQLIFSGAYIVGLQTSKLYVGLSQLNQSKSKDDLIEAITNAYLTVLITRENKQLSDSVLLLTEKTFAETQAMAGQGLMEQTDIDQLEITVSTLRTNRDMLARQMELAEFLLKFHIGMPVDQPIVLTDELTRISNKEQAQQVLLKEFNPEQNITFKMLDYQSQLSFKNLRYQQSTLLPNIAGVYTYHKNLNEKAFDLQPRDLVAVQLSWDLFTSGQRLAKISQAKKEYYKAENSKLQVSESLKLEYAQTRSALLNAIEKYETATKNVALSNRIYRNTLVKYGIGTASSLELTQVQNQYLSNLANYYGAIMEMQLAKNKFEKISTKY